MEKNLRKRIKVNDDKKEEKTKKDIASYPFGAEELLLEQELKSMEKNDEGR